MKKWLVFHLIIVFTTSLKAASLTGYFSFCTFDIPENKPFLETYLTVTGGSVKFIPVNDSMRQGQIEVIMLIRSGDKVVHFDKYNLNSPVVSALSPIPDFIDQQRMNLDTGNYQLELTIRDKNTNEKESTIKQNVRINYPTDTISISDIELIDTFKKTETANKFTKSGYELIPFVNTSMFYPKDITSLKFYAEIYRSDKITPAEDYLVMYYISNNESKKVLENFIVSSKQKPQPVNVILGNIPISNLYSGNYNLCIEVRNKKNRLLAFKQMFFQRSNAESKPMITADLLATDVNNTFVSLLNNKDTLIEYIACLYPISSSMEVETGESIIQRSDLHSMQQYIYYFWSKRNPDDPGKAFNDYKIEVQKAKESFSTQINKGYETDRGRVFLQYGPPNIISDNKDEAGSYPYEVWQYYKLKEQSNRKFVFYAKERSSNEFKLLHSDAIGEINDPNWQVKLYGSQQFGTSLDPVKPINIYGNHSEDNYTNPH